MSLNPGDLVDFFQNNLYPYFIFGDSDYENFGSQFLLSALVEGDEDNDCIVVSNHMFQLSKYGLEKFPDPTTIISLLDKYGRHPIG